VFTLRAYDLRFDLNVPEEEFPMKMTRTIIASAATAAAGMAAVGSAFAQATVKEDGQWRAALGASYTASGGNTRSTTLAGTADAVRATAGDKTSLYASALYGSSQGRKTADLWRLGAKQDWNLTSQFYAFALGEGERDDIAGLQSRLTAGGGVGWKFFNTEALKFDVFGGAGYVAEDFDAPRLIDGAVRSSYNYATLLAGEESVHKFGQSTTARQRLVVYPNLSNRGEYRAQWDAGIAVPASQSFNLTAGLSVRHNSDPGSGVKRTDTLVTAGIQVKFD
jgi:putative salt-induced outer membrane protein YdiY